VNLHFLRQEVLKGDVVSFVFEPSTDFMWYPGQYMKVTLPHDKVDSRGIERWFTIAAPPFEHFPRITTRIAKDHPSSFKVALSQLQPGDPLEVERPGGDFVMTSLETEYVLIAGGIGITPFHAMLAQLDHDHEMPKTSVIYGAGDNEPIFHRELTDIAARLPELQVRCLVEPERVSPEIITNSVSDITVPHYFVSGPEPMVDAIQKMLITMGVSAGKIEVDHFSGYTW
jgi:ferredoxin-NADP reductase